MYTLYYIQGELTDGTPIHEQTAFYLKESAEEKCNQMRNEHTYAHLWITELTLQKGFKVL